MLLNLPSPPMTFLNIYVTDIHHILTFQTSGDTWPAAFYSLIIYPVFFVFVYRC